LGSANPAHHAKLLKSHAIGTVLGIIFLVSAIFIKPRTLHRTSKWFIWASIILLILVFTPLGETVRGSRRWLNLGIFSFQPLEVAKLGLVMYLAYFFATHTPLDTSKPRKIVMLGLPILIIAGLVFFQPNLSGVLYILIITIAIAFVGGMSGRLVTNAIGFAMIIGIAGLAVYRDKIPRIISMADPLSELDGAGYQLSQSYWAITNGKFLGRGPGESLAMYSLPDHTNDFIFPIICEEWGLVTGLFIITLFALITIHAIHIALNQNNPFRFLLGFGLGTMIGLQALINIAVTLGSFPTTGIPLPFVSSGGTSIILTLVQIGLIFNISLTAGHPAEEFQFEPVVKKRKAPEVVGGKIENRKRVEPIKRTPPLSARNKTIYRGPRVTLTHSQAVAQISKSKRKKVVAR